MMQLFSQLKNWFLNLFFKQTVICLIILFCIGIGIALSNMSSLSNSLIESQSLQNSQYQANAIINAWQLYSRAAVIRLGKIEGVTIQHDYFLKRLKKLGFPQIEMGIGINTGLVVLGNISSEKRTKYGIQNIWFNHLS